MRMRIRLGDRRILPRSILLFAIPALACSTLGRIITPATQTEVPTDAPTISPTSHFTLSSTPTPASSHTPSPAPSPPPTGQAPSAYVAQNEDGSSTYFDPELGYKLMFPENWVILELTAEDVTEALNQAAEAYPGNESFFDLAALGAENMRMMAFDLDPSSLAEGEPPSANITAQIGSPTASLGLLIHSAEQILPQILPGAEVLSTRLTTNPQGVELGIIECVIGLQSESDLLKRRVIQAYFRTSAGLVIFSAETRAAVFDQSLTQFETMMDSISLLGSGETSMIGAKPLVASFWNARLLDYPISHATRGVS